MLGRVGVGAGHQVDMAGVVGRGCVHLLAVDHEVVPVSHCPALETRQIGSGLWFGESKGQRNLSANKSGKQGFLLFFSSSSEDRWGAAACPADADADPGELLLDDVLVDTAAVLAAVFLGPTDADPSLGGNFLAQVPHQRTLAHLVGILDLTPDVFVHVLLDEPLDLVSKGLLFGCVSKLHVVSPGCQLYFTAIVYVVGRRARRYVMNKGYRTKPRLLSLSCARLIVSSVHRSLLSLAPPIRVSKLRSMAARTHSSRPRCQNRPI